MSTNERIRKIVLIAVLTSLSIVLSIVESFIPLGVPGVKIGLANTIILMAFYLYSWKEALFIDLIRKFVVGLTYSGILSVAFLLSLSGGILSYIAMLIMFRIYKRDIMVVSVTGSIFHSIGQIITASILIKSVETLYYLPIMLALSVPMGIITSLISKLALRSLKVSLDKMRPVSIIMMSTLTVFVIVLSIVYVNRKNKTELSDKTCHMYIENEDVLQVSLNDYSYDIKDGYTIEYKEEEKFCSFKVSVLNHDSNIEAPYELIIYKDGGVSIGTTSCKNKTCKHAGTVKASYERIICIPNRVVVKIEGNELPDIDNVV